MGRKSVDSAELGEFGLIARLTRGLAARPDVLLGAGDDAALLDPGLDTLIIATCDAQVEGRHFLRDLASPQEIGHKALAVNLSDIAAMGGEPLWVLVSLLLPPALDVAVLDGIYAGMNALARRFGVAVVGGNISGTSGPLVLDLTLLGKVQRGRALRRSGAHPGDRLLVTGTLGAAAAGMLALITSPGAATIPQAALEQARAAMAAPEPCVAEGRALAESGVVTAMLDVSDGFAADLGQLCTASGVGAVVEAGAVPVDDAARQIAAAYGRDPVSLALTGGEDYQLLFAVRPDGVETAKTAVAVVGGIAHEVGFVTEADAGLRLRQPDGGERPLEARGWDHIYSAGDQEPGS
ncbi:MAG TPA: thiamine-phosphate kinase [Ktedonobacterales bacterium]|nr:thiamine-phosphate kinase [Ktedonobacterales bacterium]